MTDAPAALRPADLSGATCRCRRPLTPRRWPLAAIAVLALSLAACSSTGTEGGTDGSAQPVVDNSEAPVDVTAAGSPLFGGYGEFAVAFDALNIEMNEVHQLHRIDITETRAKLPVDGGPGAFAIPLPDAGTAGGWIEADETISSVIVVTSLEAPGSRAAVLTLMAITVEPTDHNIGLVNDALDEVVAGGPGAARLVLVDDRSVLIELIDEQVPGGGDSESAEPGDLSPTLSVTVARPLGQHDAVAFAANLRAAISSRF